jgi:hypothetical protein
MSDYVYQEPQGGPAFDLLPEGQYPYIVTGVLSEPYQTNAGNTVLPLKLAVGPGKNTIWDYPSAGKTGGGQPYDNIAPFLKSCGRNPAPGQRADLTERALVGARGICQIKIEIAGGGQLKGKEVNKVHYYIFDAKAKPVQQSMPVQRQQPPDDTEPDDIPF